MPTSASPKLKEFAERLLVYEAAAGQRAGTLGSPAFRVSEKLRQPLAKLLGVGGFRAVLSRALDLAKREVTWLRAVDITADGSLAGLGELEATLHQDEIALGEAALVEQLLELLVIFIGLALTLQVIQGAWAKANFDDLYFGKGESHDKTN